MKTPNRFRAAIELLINGVPATAQQWRQEFGAVSASTGETVSESTMLSLSTVWACARLIAETISTLPLNLYERQPNGGRKVAVGHPLQGIISQQPNADTTACVHWESTVVAMLLRGNARAEKLLVGGRLVGLQFLEPCRLSVVRNTDGSLRYLYAEDFGTQREIPESRIFNIPGFSLDGRTGVSVIAYAANVMGGALAADRAAAKSFQKGLMPTVALTYPQTLRADQRTEARTALEGLSGAANAGRPVILEAGTTMQSVGINAKDAQLLESRAFSVEELCRWFRVPPHMVGHANTTVWGSGIEQQNIGFLQYTLSSWLVRIEQAIRKDLLTPAEQVRYYAEFNVEGLLRGDSAARREFYASALQNGWANRNEVRARENLPSIAGGDTFTVQSNLVPIDRLGQTP